MWQLQHSEILYWHISTFGGWGQNTSSAMIQHPRRRECVGPCSRAQLGIARAWTLVLYVTAQNLNHLSHHCPDLVQLAVLWIPVKFPLVNFALSCEPNQDQIIIQVVAVISHLKHGSYCFQRFWFTNWFQNSSVYAKDLYLFFTLWSDGQLEQNARNRKPGIDPIILWQQEQEEKAKAAAAAGPIDIKKLMASKLDRKWRSLHKKDVRYESHLVCILDLTSETGLTMFRKITA